MTSAIIVAAGSGKRMGLALPKQFVNIDGQSILWHTVSGFVNATIFTEIIIVLAKEFFNKGIALQEYFPNEKIILCAGGIERFHSVQNALNKIDKKCDQVFIHDAVRPFFSKNLLEKCLETCQAHGSAVPAIALKDSIRTIVEGKSVAQARENFRTIQTPQVFDYKKLRKAYQQDYQSVFTDDATVFEHDGNEIHLVAGEEENIKITTPNDLLWAKFKIIKKLEEF